jgi:hypothetical protein
MCFRVLVNDSKGPKPKGLNLMIYNEFVNFYKNKYSKLFVSKINGTNLSGILNYQMTEIVTNIENNIKLHFLDYLNRFVNSSFKEQNQQILKNLKGKDKIETKKLLAKELYQIKKDLLNNTLECDNKYHEWLTLHRNNIIPLGELANKFVNIDFVKININ